MRSFCFILSLSLSLTAFAQTDLGSRSTVRQLGSEMYAVDGVISAESIRQVIAEDARKNMSSLASNESRSVVIFTQDPAQKTAYGVVANYLLAKEIYPGQEDKEKHMVVGGVINNLSYILIKERLPNTLSASEKEWISKVGGLITTTVVAGGKELYDGRGHGTKDKKDFQATVLGGVVSTFTFDIPY